MSSGSHTILVCTEDELKALLDSGEVTEETVPIPLSCLFDILLEHYGYDPHWPAPNDVY